MVSRNQKLYRYIDIFDKLMPKLYEKVGRICVFGQSSLITIYVSIAHVQVIYSPIYIYIYKHIPETRTNI